MFREYVAHLDVLFFSLFENMNPEYGLYNF